MAAESFELTVEALRARQCNKWTRYGAEVLPAWVADMDFAVAEPIQAAITRLVEEALNQAGVDVAAILDEEQER